MKEHKWGVTPTDKGIVCIMCAMVRTDANEHAECFYGRPGRRPIPVSAVDGPDADLGAIGERMRELRRAEGKPEIPVPTTLPPVAGFAAIQEWWMTRHLYGFGKPYPGVW